MGGEVCENSSYFLHKVSVNLKLLCEIKSIPSLKKLKIVVHGQTAEQREEKS